MSSTTISVRKMAELLGVAKSQVGRDAQAGMPMTSVEAARAWRDAMHDVSRTKDGRIDRPAVQASAGLAVELPPAPSAPGDVACAPEDEPEDLDEHTQSYRQDRARNERIKAERAQLELDQLRGKLIELDEAKRLAFTAFRTLRDAVLNVPARVKDQCAAESDAFKVEQLLEAELVAALNDFDQAKVLRDSDEDDEAG